MTSQQEEQATALIIRAQQGDSIAYAALLTLLAATARQYARNRLGNVPWIDDVAQETLVTVHTARRTYNPRRPFAPWFYAILFEPVDRRPAERAARQRARSRRRRAARAEARGYDRTPAPRAVSIRRKCTRRLARCPSASARS